jgi:hypothetical protein
MDTKSVFWFDGPAKNEGEIRILEVHGSSYQDLYFLNV